MLTVTASVSSGQESGDDHRSLSQLFGDSVAPEAIEVYRVARKLPVEERYEYLLKQVLPAHSKRIRLLVDYLPTNPSPPVVEMYGAGEAPLVLRSNEVGRMAGGVLVSPAIELVNAAKEVGKLNDLGQKVLQRTSSGTEHQKSRLALQILIAWAGKDRAAADDSLARFIALVRESPRTDPARPPEMLVLWDSLHDPETTEQVYDLMQVVHGYSVVDQTHSDSSLRNGVFKRHLASLKSQVDDRMDRAALANANRAVDEIRPEHWIPVSRRTAQTEGLGYPNPVWIKRGASVGKLAPHDHDFLYYRVPLCGDFEIEGDLTTFSYREIRLSLGSYWLGPLYSLDQCEQGFFRHQNYNLVLNEPLLEMNEFMRVRIKSQGGTQTYFINGRPVFSRIHDSRSDPWVAVVSPWYTNGTVQNLRITGTPEIPAEIDLLLDADLPGWLPYSLESAGGPDAGWQLIARELSGTRELQGRASPELRGSHQENLLRYCRPMIEDGTIEYEFYYEAGRSAVYPALGRCCFVFDRERAGIHWLTDGKFDRTGVDPVNITEVATIRSEANPVPLIPNAWNRAKVSLQGDAVDVALNGETILTWKLSPENLRTFGLFHYSDQTEARVRNLRWRGDWPRELPAPPEQELADYSVEDELADGPELPVVFEHDFSEGLPPEKIWGGGSEGWHFHKEELPAGVRISRGSGWYSQYTLSFPVRLEGDFDVRLAYEDFQSQVSEAGEGDIQLGIIFDDDTATEFRVYRKHHHRKSGKHGQIIEAARFEQRENNTERNWYGQTSEEGTSGRIRVVRRKDQLYLLHGSGDSPHERLIDRQQVTTQPVRFAGLKAIVETHRDGETSVIWKQITVRSEKPERIADYSGMTIEKLDRRRAKLPNVERIRFNQETSPDLIQSWGTIDELQKQEDGWIVRKVGSDRWSGGAFIPMLGMAGDYDVTLDLEILKLEEAAVNQDTYLLLQNRVNARLSRNVEIKLVSTPRGKREVGLQQNTTYRNGSTQLERLKIEPLDNITRLRLARRGEVLYFVYQPKADAAERIFGYLIVGTDDIPPGFLRTMFRTGGAGKETVVKFKSMTLQAERLIKPDPS